MQWIFRLEPLLHEIMQDKGTLASSFLDWFETTGLSRLYHSFYSHLIWITLHNNKNDDANETSCYFKTYSAPGLKQLKNYDSEFFITNIPETGWRYRHGDSSWITYFDWAFTFGFQELGPSLDKRTDPTEVVRYHPYSYFSHSHWVALNQQNTNGSVFTLNACISLFQVACYSWWNVCNW